jgi:hypothetical protein
MQNNNNMMQIYAECRHDRETGYQKVNAPEYFIAGVNWCKSLPNGDHLRVAGNSIVRMGAIEEVFTEIMRPISKQEFDNHLDYVITTIKSL